MLENNSVLHNSFRKCIYNTHMHFTLFLKSSLFRRKIDKIIVQVVYIYIHTVGETDVQAIYKKIKRKDPFIHEKFQFH